MTPLDKHAGLYEGSTDSLLAISQWHRSQLMRVRLVQVRYRPTAAGSRSSRPYQKSTASASVRTAHLAEIKASLITATVCCE
jgi:hypothetical protein